MEEKRIKGTWVRSSSTPNRAERLKAHMEFEASDLKRMLDDGWQVKSKRPRIKKEKPVFRLFGTLECKFEIPIEVLIKAGFAK
jgi:hypothetical protein